MKITRTFDIVDSLLENYKKDDALAVKRYGKWEKFSTEEYAHNVNLFSYGLLAMGYKKQDKIITVSNNRPEWNFMDLGMSQVGVVHVPVYPTIGIEEYEHILAHSDARTIIVSSQEYYDKIKPIADKTANIENIYTIDEVAGAPNWNEIMEEGKKNEEKLKEEVISIKKSIQPDELMSIIYTSGTTGRSKGVMLCHENFVSNVKACESIMPINGTHRFLSFLPLCHVFERMVTYYWQYMGASLYYAENFETIGENMREINPHGFAAVPRVVEKLFDKILLKGKELTGIKKTLFFWAVNLGLRYELNKANGWWYEFQLKLANKLIFSKWREALGGNIFIIVSGSAPLQPRLARIFTAAGLPIQEGYGLTETSPVIAVNHATYPLMKFGAVGPVVNNIEVKIAEDGEILMRGPSLMIGYYKNKEKTDEVIDKEGWFHTGDIGKLHEHNILQITDRKKEIFKLSTGKYVAPQIVENKFKESSLIEQLMVVGAGEKYAAAIISPSFEYLHGWCFKNNIKFRDNTDLIKKQKVLDRYQKEIDELNETLGRHNQIKKFELTGDEWSPLTGELSPTLKLKRKEIKAKYKAEFDRLYDYV